jgi:hypothetical protein
MKILFSMRHPGALRNYTSTLKELARRGHQIHLAFMMQDKLGDGRLLWELTNDHPEITYGELGKKTPWRFWLGLARVVRYATDYVRYGTPEYVDAGALSERAANKVPRPLRVIMKPLIRSAAGRAVVGGLLRMTEAAIPVDRWIADLIAVQKPDVVLITPLVDLGSDQVEYVKAARALGVRSGLCVHSWDNLTNKGLIRVVPDRVFVWNEAQKREAVAMHGVRPEQVSVTGAPVYDQWFARRPSTTREEFCAKVGLPADKPFFLYLCSSQFIAPDESTFVEKWIRAVRSAPDPRVREAGILVRPHPENLQPWQRFEFDEFKDVVLWPRGGANPVDASSKNDYYDSMYHSIAAVGINTSAQIEAGIVGRTVYSIRVPEYQGTQEGTLHFHYLLSENGGLLHMASTLEEHAVALSRAIDRNEDDDRRLRAFVRGFVRPKGLDVPATPILADGVEELARQPKPAPRGAPFWAIPLRFVVLYPVALVMKAVRYFTRLSRKRERQLRPLSVGDFFVKRLFKLLDFLFRFQPIKRFARRYVVPRVVPQMMTGDTPTEEMVAIPRTLQKLARSDRKIIVGPWLSEVGFELLYWIPFLNWVKTYRPFDPDRLVVVSRGGVAPWYKNIANNYIDLFDFYTPEQFRAKNEQRLQATKHKQMVMTEFDREILKLVYQHLGSKQVDTLHPMYMYRLFYPFWKSQMSLSLVEQFASFERLPPIDASDIAAKLPDDYIAMRFYFNESFPDCEENRIFITNLLRTLTETRNVVLLNPDLHIDDHWDLSPTRNSRVFTVDHLMTPRNNLEVQTKVISRARAFVGTYGGLSYLAPMYGVTSLAFYSNREKFSVQHLELARRVFGKFKRGCYVVLDTSDLEVLGMAFGDRAAALTQMLSPQPGVVGASIDA